jgi:hypothetical protein
MTKSVDKSIFMGIVRGEEKKITLIIFGDLKNKL